MLDYKINIERKYLWAVTLVLLLLFAVVLIWALLDKIKYTSPIGLGDAVLPDRAVSSIKIYSGGGTQAPDSHLLFVGDIMLDRNVEALIEKNGFDYLFADLNKQEFFSGYDIISANLEGPVTENGEYYPPDKEIDFAFKPEHVDSLLGYGFNFFTIANNHLYDQGVKGVGQTRDYLRDQGIDHSGDWEGRINENSFTKKKIHDRSIGLASFSTVAVDLDKEKLADKTTEWSEVSDILIVNIHWGSEYTPYPGEKQKELARLLADSGADIVIGHHPHVVQAVEIYDGVPIFYSLGNFVFDQYFSQETQQGLALAVEIGPQIGRVSILPVKSELSSVRLMDKQEKKEMFDFLSKVSGWDVEETMIFLHSSK